MSGKKKIHYLLPFSTRPLLILPELAMTAGLKEAIILQQIHYWVELNRRTGKNKKKGFYWTFNSMSVWCKQFPFWSKSTIKRTIDSLKKKNLIITGNFNRLKIDRTVWYRVNYAKLKELGINSGLFLLPRIEELKNMPYKDYLQTPEWAEKRRQKLKQADYACEVCNASDIELHVHHRTYKNRGDELLTDLTVLCKNCHTLFHENQKAQLRRVK